MKSLFITLCVIAYMVAECRANTLQFDIKVTQLLGNNKTVSEESEIFLEERLLTEEPPSIYLDDFEDESKNDEFVGRKNIDLSNENFEQAFGKKERQADEHANFALGFGAGLVKSPYWSSWTCCRHKVNIQSRERVVQAPRIEMEYKKCSNNYCSESNCKDDIGVCQDFISSMGKGLCDVNHMMSTFMSQHCPKTCNFCAGSSNPFGGFANLIPTTSPQWPWATQSTRSPYGYQKTTRRPWRPPTTTSTWPWRPQTSQPSFPWGPPTTQAPWRPHTSKPDFPWGPPTTQATVPWRPNTPTTWFPTGNGDANLVKVTVLSHSFNSRYPSYMYSISKPRNVGFPWKQISPSNRNQDISSFYLYRNPTDVYKVPIYFCRSRARNSVATYKWSISKNECARGWTLQFLLYGSFFRTSSSQILYVGNSGRPNWSARVSRNFPSNGYTSSVFYFYTPKSASGTELPTYKPPTTTRPTYTYSTRPPYTFTTRNPYATTQNPFFTTRPIRPTTRPIGGGQQPTDSYNRECLEAHNFFRAVHNVPALQWSPELARTSQSWSNRLKQIAPNRPNELRIPSARTRNWPHSESGKGHRNNGDGENIAWDLSGDGSPARESVLRWYSEIFYYNRNHPTSGTPNKPVGHLTQMLWKDTTHLGCAAAVTDLSSSYKQQSTWSVAHYSPGGNIRYGNSFSKTLQLYNEMVPDMRRGSCMTNSGSCFNGNQCMAFGPAQGSCVCQQSRPVCRSNGGCIAWCENKSRRYNWKEECEGRSECKCTNSAGAVCT